MKYKRELGLIFGLVICLFVWFMPEQAGLSVKGQHCLALSLLAVVWWATGVTHPGFTALFMLSGYVLTGIAEPAVVFKLWTTPLIYLIVGGFLIAAAVESSGLGKRIAYHFILRYVNSFTSIIAAAYILGFILSFMIPHPWPRSFLIMSVMAIIIKEADLPAKDAANIGLAVFAASVPTSLILLTGDSTLNVVAMGFAGQEPSWLGWLYYMGVPGVAACILTFLLQINLFKSPDNFSLNKTEIQNQLENLGPVSRTEKITLFWVVVAIIVWATDCIHKVNPGWVALGTAIMLSLPRIGDVLKPSDWTKVNLGTLFFLTAALSIGTVGGATGMNKWVAAVFLPDQVPANPFIFAALTAVVTICIHATLGSALAVMGLVAPAIIAYAAGTSLNSIVPALLVYTACMHWIFPFNHANVLIGLGDSGGKYSDSDVLRFGIPLIAVVLIVTVAVEIPWWYVIGLIK